MKKILALLVLCSVIITVNAQVQRKKTTPIADSAAATANKAADNKGGRKDMMKELHLTKLQKHKLKEMRLSGKTKMSEIQNDAKLSEEEKKTKLHKQQMESTLAVLNDEQKAKFKKMQKGKKQGKREEMELEQ
jgi:hypothetical protein